MLDYYVRSSATMAPSKTSAVTRRSTRVAVKKSVASTSVKESALTTSAARGRQKATKVVSIAKVGLASRTGKASKKGTEVVSRDTTVPGLSTIVRQLEMITRDNSWQVGLQLRQVYSRRARRRKRQTSIIRPSIGSAKELREQAS